MSVVTQESIMERIKTTLGDRTDDEAISLVEDINDTMSSMRSDVESAGSWRQKYEENDAQWREKYRNRFFEGDQYDNVSAPPEENKEEDKPLTYEDLFD